MKISKTLKARSSLLLGALLAIGVPALAAPITGGFGTVGAGVISYTTALGDHKIDFCPPDPSSPDIGSGSCNDVAAGPGEGLFLAYGGSGTFAGIVSPIGGTIKDMVDSLNPIYDPSTFIPVGVSGLEIDNFLTLSGFPVVNFQVNEFVEQTCAPSEDTLCVGGFILTKVGTSGVTVSFTLNGTVIAPGFDPTPFEYVVAGSFNNTTKEALAAQAGTPDGIFANTWSGSFNTIPGEIPEPSTITMFGLAAIAMLFGRLHSKRGSDS